MSDTDVAADALGAAEAVFVPREVIESPQDRLIDSVTASQQDAIDSVESAGKAAAEGLGLARQAFGHFIAERLRQDLATQRALLGCRSLAVARALGFAHVRTAVDQYGREAARMYGIGTGVARRSLERPRLARRDQAAPGSSGR